ncbi:hypothetical protein [Neptuniibacter sp. QD37_11]|uniref:hypothetical protein n=1 Tax=Neptuniibacter sp. QD37_11 TaxID=3398209 RepID=UPI0039F4DF73
MLTEDRMRALLTLFISENHSLPIDKLLKQIKTEKKNFKVLYEKMHPKDSSIDSPWLLMREGTSSKWSTKWHTRGQVRITECARNTFQSIGINTEEDAKEILSILSQLAKVGAGQNRASSRFRNQKHTHLTPLRVAAILLIWKRGAATTKDFMERFSITRNKAHHLALTLISKEAQTDSYANTDGLNAGEFLIKTTKGNTQHYTLSAGLVRELNALQLDSGSESYHPESRRKAPTIVNFSLKNRPIKKSAYCFAANPTTR